MIKRVLITHTWSEDRGETKWLFWLQKKLESLGVMVNIQALNKKNFHTKWFDEVKKSYGVADENVYTITHDPGCLTILKYIEYLSGNNISDTHLLVAGTSAQGGGDQYIRLESTKDLAIFSNPSHSLVTPNPFADAHLIILYSADPEQLASGNFKQLTLKGKEVI